MTQRNPKRRCLTIGVLMTWIALLCLPIFLAVPIVQTGGIPHHMTIKQTVRWLAIDRGNACLGCHGRTVQNAAFEIPGDAIEARNRGHLLTISD